jgi:thiol-disulfide isomerase/thioredoxin
MKHFRCFVLSILLVTSFVFVGVRGVSAQDTSDQVVRVVLFYSPTCPHCEKVITQDLPPLQQKYGDSLMILGIDITVPQGLQIYQATVKALGIPNTRLGVPTLIVADQVLVGSAEIPQLLPGLIEQYLAQGGVGWPAIPGLEEVVSGLSAAATETPLPS